MVGLVRHGSQLEDARVEGWSRLRSMWSSSPAGAVRLGLDAQTAASDVTLSDAMRAREERRSEDAHVRVHPAEQVTVNGTPAVRERTEFSSGDVPFVRVELFWAHDGQLWRAWAVAPVGAQGSPDAELAAIVQTLLETNTGDATPDTSSWAEASESWSEVRSWF